MMILTVDIGNTAVGAALFQGGTLTSRLRFSTPLPGAEGPWISLKKWGLQKEIDAVMISSVVPRLDSDLLQFIKRETGLNPRFLDHRTPLEITLDIDHPEEVGADRIADVMGALEFVSPPCIVIDSGTALTLDVLDGDYRYCGGVIIPGVEISIRSLSRHAARLEKVEFTIPRSPLGRNTADCIRSGVYYSHLGGMELLIREYMRQLGPDTRIIATGGAIEYFRDRLKLIHRYEPDLVHHGLRRIHAQWSAEISR